MIQSCPATISFKQKRWVLPPEGPDAHAISRLAESLRCPPLVAGLLHHRGMADVEAAREFLQPEFKKLCDPMLLPNIAAAVERIAAAISAKEHIVLFGDYDVDGITGAAMLWHVLNIAGAAVRVYVPHRVEEGYGLSCDAVSQIIDGGATLIVSVDCGIASREPVALARSRGVDVIISDHHEIPAELPDATTIVHPRLEGSAYPNPDLCGAGVAYKLAWALASHLCGGGKVSAVYRDLLIEFSALVGLGTIADVMPLIGENRILAYFGLRQLPRSTLLGVQALIGAAGYAEKKIDGTAVGFGLAPRLNAAGRMGHASLAVELLTTATAERAAEIADYLEEQNGDRQATERKIVLAAKKQIDEWPVLPPVIVVHAPQWHAGVVGIVASRLVESYGRPAFVLGGDGEIAHGSARSIECFALHDAIEQCRDLLISGGGHAMAAGVKLPAERLDAFRQRICDYAAGVLDDESLIPPLHVHGELTLADCDPTAIGHLAAMEPFGRGNPPPRFLIREARLTTPPRRVGASGSHLQLQLAQNGKPGRAIAFRMGELAPALPVGMEVDVVVEPKLDHYNGAARTDLHVIDIARSDGEMFDLH